MFVKKIKLYNKNIKDFEEFKNEYITKNNNKH